MRSTAERPATHPKCVCLRIRPSSSAVARLHARALIALGDRVRGYEPLGHFLTRARREQERAKVDKELERLWCITACVSSVQCIVHFAAALSPAPSRHACALPWPCNNVCSARLAHFE
jgi:RPA family protein